jgi:hypothetical protein
VARLGRRLEALDFDAVCSAFWDRGDIDRDAKAAVERSVSRQIHGPKASIDYREENAA